MNINQKASQNFILLKIFVLLVFTSFRLFANDTLSLKPEDFKYANNQRFTITGDLPPLETNLSNQKILITSLAVGSIFAIQHFAQMETIWKEGAEFKITEDGAYGLYADKPGHLFSGYAASYIFSEAMFGIGMDKNDATIYGTLLGWIYLNYIEVMDGYGANFGFSPSDLYANSAGSLFYLLQNYFPYLQNITPKFTYIPADWHGEDRRVPHLFFVDDYSSQTFWLSFNVHNMLPENMKDYWPPWMELSIGYAARNLWIDDDGDNMPARDPSKSFYHNWGKNSSYGSPKYIVSLDWNLVQLIPDGPNWLNWTKQTLNLFKFPSPAIEFSPDLPPKYTLIYPFSIW